MERHEAKPEATSVAHETEPAPVIPVGHILDWLAEKDSALAGAMAELQYKQPDLFTNEADTQAAIIKAARLAERQDLLEEIAQAVVDFNKQ